MLIEKHGEPDNIGKLEEYLDFVLNYIDADEKTYNETHHILTQSQFPEYVNAKWNKVKLKYEDHIKAHDLLYETFNLRTYQYCLRFMKPYHKNSEQISNAAKKGWIKLKNDPEKYIEWHDKRQRYLENMPETQKERISIKGKKVWENYTDEQYEKRCLINRSIWTEDVRKKKSILQSEYAKNNPEEMSKRMIKRWNDASSEDRESFIKKMILVNSDKEKREKAGKTMQDTWKDPAFREKMKNRKSVGFNYKCIFPDGDIKIFTSLSDANKNGMNITLMRKYADTDIEIPSPKKQANSKKNLMTVGCKIFKLKK
jgi:hypothetical protein